MKKIITVAIVVLAVFFVAGNVSAAQLPIVNGDFEVAQPGWGTAPFGWLVLAVNGGAQIPIAAVCPDGGPTAIIYSGATNVNATLAFIQTTDNVIESGKTYVVTMDVGTENYYSYRPEYPQASVALVLNAQPAEGAATRLGAIECVDADFTANYQWNTYSITYVADSTHVGKKLQVYVQFSGKDFGPWVDSVRLYDATHNLVVSPATTAFENPLSGSNQASYTVALDGVPASDVTVRMLPVGSGTTLSASMLTFTNANWNIPQTVTATVDNKVNTTATRTVTIVNTATSEDPNFNLPPANAAITVYNDDVAWILYNAGDGIVVDEQGATSDTYTVQLLAQPVSTVTVTSVVDLNNITVSAPVSFTTSDWYQIKTVTITAVDDSVIEQGDHTSSIGHTISGDAVYAALTPGTLTATIHDNDCGAWGWLVGDFAGAGFESDGRPIGDCIVDFKDVAFFAEQWLKCTTPYEVGCFDAR